MNITKNHTLDIIVNGENLELSENSINLRMNRVINQPNKLSTTQGEYSFTFNVPVTKHNAKLFNHINVPSRNNKFNTRYGATVIADGITIFEGTLKITGIDNNEFKCNLYKSKVNTIDNIFGDMTMNQVKWSIPFNGINTINQLNADENSKVFFPLVAYSLFQKSYKYDMNNPLADKLSGKYEIDDTNKFYYNSFIPSVNLIELLKKICETKGYMLSGNILSNPIMNNIYLSNYIADKQDPLYNYGSEEMGVLEFESTFQNWNPSWKPSSYYNVFNGVIYHTYDYKFSYPTRQDGIIRYDNYNGCLYYSLISQLRAETDGDYYCKLNVKKNNSKMLLGDGDVIQIPCDGWWEITVDAEIGIPDSQGTIEALQNKGNANEKTQIPYSRDNMPVEMQVLRYNASDGDASNITPEPIYYGVYPNEEKPMVNFSTNAGWVWGMDYYSNAKQDSDFIGDMWNITKPICIPKLESETDTLITAIDAAHNDSFICGISQSTYGSNIGYIKNGRSYDKTVDAFNESLYNCDGYYIYNKSDIPTKKKTDKNKNSLKGITDNVTVQGRKTRGKLHLLVKLNKNDMIKPILTIRKYVSRTDDNLGDIPAIYKATCHMNFKIRAVAPKDTNSGKLSYNSNSLFSKDLELGNFQNQEQKISEFITNVQKAFNLSISQNGNQIVMDTNIIADNYTTPIDIDNRTNINDAVFTSVEYPASVEVKFNVNTEEEGFYRSVEENTTPEQMQSPNWKDYGDYGYSKVDITNADDAQPISQQLQFSHNWYREFQIKNDKQNAKIKIPVIGKSEWWIEGYKYEEYARYDGRGFRQRFWFRDKPTNIKLKVNVSESLNESETYIITTPIPTKTINGELINLTYYNNNNSLLNRFFNININPKNDEIEVECYLTPSEFIILSKCGCVKFDDDIYQINEITGYDPLNNNPTKLLLMKK